MTTVSGVVQAAVQLGCRYPLRHVVGWHARIVYMFEDDLLRLNTLAEGEITADEVA